MWSGFSGTGASSRAKRERGLGKTGWRWHVGGKFASIKTSWQRSSIKWHTNPTMKTVGSAFESKLVSCKKAGCSWWCIFPHLARPWHNFYANYSLHYCEGMDVHMSCQVAHWDDRVSKVSWQLKSTAKSWALDEFCMSQQLENPSPVHRRIAMRDLPKAILLMQRSRFRMMLTNRVVCTLPCANPDIQILRWSVWRNPPSPCSSFHALANNLRNKSLVGCEFPIQQKFSNGELRECHDASTDQHKARSWAHLNGVIAIKLCFFQRKSNSAVRKKYEKKSMQNILNSRLHTLPRATVRPYSSKQGTLESFRNAKLPSLWLFCMAASYLSLSLVDGEETMYASSRGSRGFSFLALAVEGFSLCW